MIGPTEHTWLSVRDAAAYLGVSEGTLRSWADAGDVPSHRTPGGHRRFLQAELARRVAEPGTAAGMADGLAGKALSRIRKRVQGAPAHGPGPWMALLSDVERTLLREQGRRLVDLASEYLTKPRHRSRIAREAFEIGAAYGSCMAGHHLPLSQAMDTFVFFRNLVAATADGTARGGGVSAVQQQDVQRHLQGLLDQVMLGIVHAYEHDGTAGALLPAEEA